MSGNPEISVIICTWNRAASLRSTLQSLSGQVVHGKVLVEVIVVDNNSTDTTKAVVEEAARDWHLGTLQYVFEARQGKQFALNTGVRISHGRLLAFTDDDVFFSSDWLSEISRVFEDPSLELTGGKTLIVWPEAGKPSWFDREMSAILAGVDIGDERKCPPPEGYAPAGSNLVARRALFDRVGLYSESHFRHMDYEFGMRCAREGVCVSYEPTLVVSAPVDPACLTKRYFRRWSFKAGIARDQANATSTATPPPVPRWVYRQFAEDCIFVMLRYLHRDSAHVFKRELRAWRAFGTIASRWYALWRPADYPRWVEKYSQKKMGLY